MLSNIIYAIEAIQELNCCHLDIKPSNVLINLKDNGEWDYKCDLVLTDFGLSGTIDSAVGQCGTPGFGSPEQFLGQVHLKSDNFALGKMAVLILFPWDVAWDLLSRPIWATELKNEIILKNNCYVAICQLLNVSRFRIFLSYNLVLMIFRSLPKNGYR